MLKVKPFVIDQQQVWIVCQEYPLNYVKIVKTFGHSEFALALEYCKNLNEKVSNYLNP